MSSGAITSATAIRIADVGEASKFFFTLSAVVISGAGCAIVAFLSAVCALNYRTKMMPMRTSYLGWLAAAGFLVGNYGSASDANALGLIGSSRSSCGVSGSWP